MSERITYPKGLNAISTASLNSPPANPALAARQLSAAESRMMSNTVSTQTASLAAAEAAIPPPSMISQVGNTIAGLGSSAAGVVGGIASSAASLIPGAAGAALNAVTGGGIGDAISGLSSLANGDIAGGMSSLSNALSSAAGLPTGVPAGAEVVSEELPFTQINPSNGSDWRVKISAPFDLVGGTLAGRLEATNGLIFPYQPTVSISTTAAYNTMGFTHNNYPFNSYKNSQVDDITIAGEFSCETPEDAEYWLAATLFLRAATKMFFGASSNVGNPPIICKLNGYGLHVFNDISCVIKNFNITLPQDVDYILYTAETGRVASAWDSHATRDSSPATSTHGEKTWVPILSEISVTVSPIYSREKIRKFNLQDYTSGNVRSTKGFA